MANVVGVVNDIFEVLREAPMKKDVLAELMTEVLEILGENMVLEGHSSELDDCLGIHPALDEAIEAYYNINSDEDDDGGSFDLDEDED